MLNNYSLQDRILQQLQIVHKNQIFPIWVSKFVHLKICIGNNIFKIHEHNAFYNIVHFIFFFQMI
jgi:hypothetical protein